MWEEYRNLVQTSMEKVRKAKAQMEIKLAGDIRDDKKGFYKSTDNEKKARENVGTLTRARIWVQDIGYGGGRSAECLLCLRLCCSLGIPGPERKPSQEQFLLELLDKLLNKVTDFIDDTQSQPFCEAIANLCKPLQTKSIAID